MERNIDSLSPPETDLLDRYLAGILDDVERGRVEAWVAANPGWEQRADILGATLRAMSGSAGVAPETAEEWATTILAEEPTARSKGRRVSRNALAGALGLMAGVAFLVVGWSQWGRWIAQTVAGDSSARVSLYSTGSGERATITLPDGSIAILNVASRIEVPSDYDRGNRTITLRGEALFTVKHHRGSPFTVVAGPSVTRVLGTSFVVRHYDTDTAAIVAVRDGKVGVGDVVLTAAQQAKVNRIGEPTVSDANAAQFTFASGILTLNNMTLKEAVVELNRWYNADIRIANPELDTRGIRGAFGRESISELATMLEFMFDIRVEQRGRVLTLYSR